MNALVRQLRHACTGGIQCECSYRLAADEIERLEMELAASAARYDAMYTLATRKEDALVELQAAIIGLQAKLDEAQAHASIVEASNAALRAELVGIASQKPIAWVPLHPRNGPLWAMTTDSPDSERLPSYELMQVYARAKP